MQENTHDLPVEINPRALLEAAVRARRHAHAPYSHFRVGAALLCADGTVFTGCNIENAAYTPTNCAERTAIFKAVSEGRRDFIAIAVVGGPYREDAPDEIAALCAPCGVCRQVLAEFCEPTLPIILGTPSSPRLYTLGDLLPLSFTAKDL